MKVNQEILDNIKCYGKLVGFSAQLIINPLLSILHEYRVVFHSQFVRHKVTEHSPGCGWSTDGQMCFPGKSARQEGKLAHKLGEKTG